MSRGFWDKLKKPFFVLAPMANVTDAAFRELIAKYGKPDAFWTEFVSADGLCSSGKKKLLVDLWFSKKEHPIVAQIFGARPENFFKAAKLIKDLGFDGLDINMGCPDRAILKQGAGGALIKNPKLAKEIFLAAKEGSEGLPVSIKTRTGFGKDELEDWLPHLFEVNPAVITIHARTVRDLSEVPARWEQVALAVKMAKELSSTERPLILGNGDIKDLAEAKQHALETGADGIMIGRGIFGNPWLFSDLGYFRNPDESQDLRKDPESSSGLRINVAEKLRVMIEHTKLFEEKFWGIKNFDIMKKHYKAYVTGFAGAKEFRTKLMETKDSREVEKLVDEYLTKK